MPRVTGPRNGWDLTQLFEFTDTDGPELKRFRLPRYWLKSDVHVAYNNLGNSPTLHFTLPDDASDPLKVAVDDKNWSETLRVWMNKFFAPGISACAEETTGRYTFANRKSPRYDAKKCQGEKRKGADGHEYRSTHTGRGYIWKKIKAPLPNLENAVVGTRLEHNHQIYRVRERRDKNGTGRKYLSAETKRILSPACKPKSTSAWQQYHFPDKVRNKLTNQNGTLMDEQIKHIQMYTQDHGTCPSYMTEEHIRHIMHEFDETLPSNYLTVLLRSDTTYIAMDDDTFLLVVDVELFFDNVE